MRVRGVRGVEVPDLEEDVAQQLPLGAARRARDRALRHEHFRHLEQPPPRARAVRRRETDRREGVRSRLTAAEMTCWIEITVDEKRCWIVLSNTSLTLDHEHCHWSGYTSDAADAALQANIVAAGYGQ